MHDDWNDGDDLDTAAPALGSPARREDAEMDITPMIDVTFLLLIFFIVCSVTDQQSTIELARAKHGKGVSERDSIVFLVEEGGLDGAPVALEKDGTVLATDPQEQKEEIRAAVEKAVQTEQKHDALIKADRNVACRDVEQVIKGVSKVEGVRIHLAVMEND